MNIVQLDSFPSSPWREWAADDSDEVEAAISLSVGVLHIPTLLPGVVGTLDLQ